ncbi:lactonase family protein [Photobacterium damselae]|uniref:lactonase family protein n=1 Tax=Photobacterium damselae TaxID=38293 RepID=UPI0010FD4BA8|nr:beta-propeller fold lactonase family protein [Photobacterium damselae]TLS80663.1 lactonase family protein [Photobacterium damselae subsp. damselae]
MNLFAVGSYTHSLTHVPDARGKGVSLIGLNDQQALNTLCVNDLVENPTYLVWDRSRQLLVSACEAGTHPGRLDLFSLEQQRTLAHHQTCLGNSHDACHINLSANHSVLVTASYGGGQISAFSFDNNDNLKYSGCYCYSGFDNGQTEHKASHAHQTMPSPDSGNLYVCDLGSDTIWMHSPVSLPSLSQDSLCTVALKLAPEYGPRHLLFHPELPLVYILCEHKPAIVIAKISVNDTLQVIGEIPSMDESGPIRQNVSPAGIKLHPSGNTLVVSNRFHDTVSVFKINSTDGLLFFSGEYDCGGKTPRDIEFSGDGSLLLIANQDSHRVTSLQFNKTSGLCTGVHGPSIDTGSPVCLIRLS